MHVNDQDNEILDSQEEDGITEEYGESSDGDSGHVQNQYAEELVERCTELLDELDHFQKVANREHTSLKSGQDGSKGKNKLVTAVEMRHFRNAVQMELRGLEALTQQDPGNEKVSCMMQSSNLIFLEAVWAVAKNCRGIESIVKTFYYTETVLEDGVSQRKRVPVKVDIVAQAGVEWIKVCTIRQSRLMFEIGKATWGFEDEQDEDGPDYATSVHTDVTFLPDFHQTASTHSQTFDEDASDSDEDDGESTDALAIIRTAKALIKASRQTRIQYLHPSVTIVLSNVLYDPQTAEQPLKNFINRILATGARVQTSNGLLKFSPAPALEDVIDKLIVTPSLIAENITDPVNIDTTILLALVSDISHQDVPIEPRFHETVLRQLQLENETHFLPSVIYPLCKSRQMVCTDEAYKRFMSITDIVGSKTEKLRATLIAQPQSQVEKQQGDDDVSTRIEIHTKFQELSIHLLPLDLFLPIKIVPSMDAQFMTENTLAAAVGAHLSANNRSVLFTGWRERITTLTSNGSVAKRLETLIEQRGTESVDVSGPQVLVLPTSRSLVGTAKKGGEIVGSYRGYTIPS